MVRKAEKEKNMKKKLYFYLTQANIIKDVETIGTMDPEVRFKALG